MKLEQIANDALTIRCVFGDPCVTGGVTVIPAAAVAGMAGGGSGHNTKGEDGEGGGFGLTTRPVGAYVIQGDKVTWRPAVDLTRLATVAAAVAVVFMVTSARRASSCRGTPGDWGREPE
jgi:uncharacterized spore protein YtfJ